MSQSTGKTRMKPSRWAVAIGTITALITGLAFMGYFKLQADVEACGSRLPNGLKLSSELFDTFSPQKGQGMTVRTKLWRMGAYCEGVQIYNRFGTPVAFERIPYDWPGGGPSEGESKRRTLVREQYTIIDTEASFPSEEFSRGPAQ